MECQMKKIGKKGIELAINTIIIMALALTVLVVGIYFITNNFRDLNSRIKEFPRLEVEPTPERPIEFIPSIIERGKQNKMTIGFYNNELSEITKDIIPAIMCDGINEVLVESSGLNIPVGSWKSYAVLVSVPKDTKPSQYSCVITINKAEKSFFMEVK